jgi:hypothetical protein
MFDVHCGGKLSPELQTNYVKLDSERCTIERTYHEFTEAFVDLSVQIQDEICVCNAVYGPPEGILLC